MALEIGIFVRSITPLQGINSDLVLLKNGKVAEENEIVSECLKKWGPWLISQHYIWSMGKWGDTNSETYNCSLSCLWKLKSYLL